MFLIQGWLSVPLWAFAILLLCLSVLMTWGYNLSGSSILTPILMHAVFNTSYFMLVGLCSGVPTWGPGLPIYVATIGLVTAAAALGTRGRLGLDKAVTQTSEDAAAGT